MLKKSKKEKSPIGTHLSLSLSLSNKPLVTTNNLEVNGTRVWYFLDHFNTKVTVLVLPSLTVRTWWRTDAGNQVNCRQE